MWIYSLTNKLSGSWTASVELIEELWCCFTTSLRIKLLVQPRSFFEVFFSFINLPFEKILLFYAWTHSLVSIIGYSIVLQKACKESCNLELSQRTKPITGDSAFSPTISLLLCTVKSIQLPSYGYCFPDTLPDLLLCEYHHAPWLIQCHWIVQAFFWSHHN